MLTEQQLTEDIEVENEHVDRHTTHSEFFDSYYQSLQDIELGNRQLLDAQEQFRWYTIQLDEIDRIADKNAFDNSSQISVEDSPEVVELDRIKFEKNLQLFYDEIEQSLKCNNLVSRRVRIQVKNDRREKLC